MIVYSESPSLAGMLTGEAALLSANVGVCCCGWSSTEIIVSSLLGADLIAAGILLKQD